MAKKKRTDTKTNSGPTKQTPAMYPTPAPVELATPQKIVAFDPKTKTITIEGSPPPEVLAMAEIERRRLNLMERLTGYAKRLATLITPHWGERPKDISPAKWRNLEQRIKAMAELPENAPAEARNALMALHTLNRLVEELVEADDWPETIDRAICYAIDFGKLLQRGQSQIDHGANVDRGKRVGESQPRATRKAQEVNRQYTEEHIKAACAEYDHRMANEKRSGMKNATRKSMAEKGWGSAGSIKRWLEERDHEAAHTARLS